MGDIVEYIRDLVARNTSNNMILEYLKQEKKIDMSNSTLKRYKKEHNIRRYDHAVGLFEVQNAIRRERETVGRNTGVRFLAIALRLRHGLLVTRRQVQDACTVMTGLSARGHRMPIHRRMVYCPGPNYRWCEDGHDKLGQTWGIFIHGCIDEYSRRLLWLRAYSTNRKPEIIAKYYLETVKQLGVEKMSNVDAWGIKRGRCKYQNCTCPEYENRNGSVACKRVGCAHSCAKHEKTVELPPCSGENGGSPCDCSGWDPAPPPMTNQCLSCCHGINQHRLPSVADARGTDQTRQAWALCASAASNIRRTEHAESVKPGNRGGYRPNSGRKRLTEGRRAFTFIPVKTKQTGVVAIGHAAELMVQLPLEIKAACEIARQHFAKELGFETTEVLLEDPGEVLYKYTNGVRYNETTIQQAKRIYYYNPQFQNWSIGGETRTSTGSKRPHSDEEESESDSQQGGATLDATIAYGDPNCNVTSGSSHRRSFPIQSAAGNSQPVSSPNESAAANNSSIPSSTIGSDGLRHTPLDIDRRQVLLDDSRYCSTPMWLNDCTQGECSTFQLDLPTAESNQPEIKFLRFYAEMYCISEKTMRLIYELNSSDEIKTDEWMQSASRSGVIGISELVNLHQYFAFQDRENRGADKWQIEVDRTGKSRSAMQRQMLALFKQDKNNYKRLVSVTFTNEGAVGPGLIDSWVTLLRENIIAPRFEGEQDHLLPKKSFDVVCDWKTIGRIMGHIVRQQKVVMVGLSPVVKEVISGKSPDEISIVTADLPDMELRQVITKILDSTVFGRKASDLTGDEIFELLDSEEIALFASCIAECECTENTRLVHRNGASLLIPHKGYERHVAYVVMYTVVIGHRREQVTELAAGLNEVCKLAQFVQYTGVGSQTLKRYFPSIAECIVTCDDIKQIMEYKDYDGDDTENPMHGIVESFNKFINSLREELSRENHTNEETPRLRCSDFLQWCTGSQFLYGRRRVSVSVCSGQASLVAHTCFGQIEVNESFYHDSEGLVRELYGAVASTKCGDQYNAV